MDANSLLAWAVVVLAAEAILAHAADDAVSLGNDGVAAVIAR
jgi:hypothetical protein